MKLDDQFPWQIRYRNRQLNPLGTDMLCFYFFRSNLISLFILFIRFAMKSSGYVFLYQYCTRGKFYPIQTLRSFSFAWIIYNKLEKGDVNVKTKVPTPLSKCIVLRCTIVCRRVIIFTLYFYWHHQKFFLKSIIRI